MLALGRKMTMALAQLIAVDPDESRAEATGDWQYWSRRATVSDLPTPTEKLRFTMGGTLFNFRAWL